MDLKHVGCEDVVSSGIGGEGTSSCIIYTFTSFRFREGRKVSD
jgi:hypothetical protein